MACGFGRRFLTLATVLQNICPFPTLARMTMLQMLSKMVGSVELLGCIAFTKLMDIGQMLDAILPISRVIWEIFTTEATCVIVRTARTLS